MNTGKKHLLLFFPAILLLAAAPICAGYKARPWNMNARESYPAFLSSEGVTIAIEPLFNDALAARVFDKKDMVTRGIMPLAVLIFNDNDFPVEVDGLSIELINGQDHIRSMSPNEVVTRLYRKEAEWIPRPVRRTPKTELNEDALDDFDAKFLMEKIVPPHGKEGGFLYLHIPSSDIVSYLNSSLVYIPKIYRRDNGSRMIFFEIAVSPAIPAGAKNQ